QLEFVAPVADANSEALLEELDVLIERAAQRGEASGIVGFERHAGGQRDNAIRLVRQTALFLNIWGLAYRRCLPCQMNFDSRAPRSVLVIAALMTTSTNWPF